MRIPNLIRLGAIVAMTCLLIPLLGCQGQTPEEARAGWTENINRLETTEGQVAAQIETLQASLQAIADQLAELPSDDELTERIRRESEAGAAALADLLAHRAELQIAVAAARDKLASIPEDATAAEIHAQMAGQAVTSAAAVLPPPWNAVALGVGTLIASAGGLFGLLGNRRAKEQEAFAREAEEATVAVVAAIENAKRVSDKLAEGLHEASSEIRNGMGPAASMRVDRIREQYGKVRAAAAAA